MDRSEQIRIAAQTPTDQKVGGSSPSEPDSGGSVAGPAACWLMAESLRRVVRGRVSYADDVFIIKGDFGALAQVTVVI